MGERCSNDEPCNCAEIGWHGTDEHHSKPEHLQYASAFTNPTLLTLGHTSPLQRTSPCATQAITEKLVVSNPETLVTTCNDDEIICSIPEQLNNEFGLNAQRPHGVAYSNAGLMTIDTERPYDKAQLCAGLLTYGAKAYSNAAVHMSTNAEAHTDAEAYECKQSCPNPGPLQTVSADTEVHVIPRETIDKTASAIIDRASAIVNPNSMSSESERIGMVAIPPPHIEPCATQLQTASATRPEPPPRSFKSKKITDYGYQTKNIAKKMADSSVENALENVPTPGQDNTKTSAVILSTNDTTSALKGFNHLPQLKGERVGGAACIPSMHPTAIFSIFI